MGEADTASRELRRACARAAVIAFTCALAAAHARAQQPLSTSVRADNDAFDFWLPPYARPDEEYTSGVRAALVYAGGAPWERRLHRDASSCATGANLCATHTLAFGQDIFTGTLDATGNSFVPGTRPDAAWLYVQEASRVATRGWLDETSVTVGLTGPPALGEAMQRTFHSIAPAFNRPINWSSQIPFEPGVVLAYDRTERMLVVGEGEWLGGDVEPHAGASLGNILTEARAGVRVRAGVNLSHPWLLAAESSVPEISFFGDATFHGVARNEFLAGTMFRPSERVQERPFVPEFEAGFDVRWRRITLTYALDRIESEYLTRAAGHTWSRIGVDWRIAR